MSVDTQTPGKWRSIREVVLQSVQDYQEQQRLKKKYRKKSFSYSGEGGGLAGIGTSRTGSCDLDEDEMGCSWGEEEEGIVELEQIGAEKTKNVLILMSDTGGGHRASAEAIRNAFQIEYGDEYKVRYLSIFIWFVLYRF